jgi:hypothetical protein
MAFVKSQITDEQLVILNEGGTGDNQNAKTSSLRTTSKAIVDQVIANLKAQLTAADIGEGKKFRTAPTILSLNCILVQLRDPKKAKETKEARRVKEAERNKSKKRQRIGPSMDAFLTKKK